MNADPTQTLLQGVAAAGILYLLFLAVILLLGVGYFVFWIRAVILCATKCPREDRLVWIIIIIFVPFGWLIYLVAGPKAPPPPLHTEVPAQPPPYLDPDVDASARNVASEIRRTFESRR